METETIIIPKWIWALLILATLGAINHTAQLYVNTSRLSDVREVMLRQQGQLDTLTGMVGDVARTGQDLDSIRQLLRDVRDDVIELKARRQGGVETEL